MKILNVAQIREADAYTIKYEPITSIDLMERASQAFCNWFIETFDAQKPIMVFCGMGNNGGDGLAIARMLLQKKYVVQVFIIKSRAFGSGDFEENYKRFNDIGKISLIEGAEMIPEIPDNAIVVDAILGSGLSRPVEGVQAEVIKVINCSKATTIAVDIASGLFADQPSVSNAITKPDYTLTFQTPKLAFMMPENATFTGQFVVVDIGLSKHYMLSVETLYHFLDHKSIVPYIKHRQKFSHKGDFGKVLLVSGSWGKVGAAVLCAKACLRAGTGLLTLHAPMCAYDILQSAVPEAMVETDERKKKIAQVKNAGAYNAIGVGPGIGTEEVTRKMLLSLLKSVKNPMVLDADALNILALDKKILKHIPKNSLLTPHPKEFERIAGKYSNSFERLELQKAFSKKHHCITIVKGAHTTTCTPSGEVYFNSTGNPGMATGGSGDVLTGILTALLGQGYNPTEAAIVGVYLHGLAGDKAAEKMGQEAMLPSDLIEHIATAYRALRE